MRQRYDRTIRTVMWLDAFLSVAMVVVCFIASPVLATVDLPQGVVTTIGVSSIVCAILLATFGAITGVLLMLRMRAGQYYLPSDIYLPLPAGMRPDTVNGRRRPDAAALTSSAAQPLT